MVTSANTVTSAENRLRTYRTRISSARTDQAKCHALVWWWLAEFKRLSASGRAAAFAELENICLEFNREGQS